VEVEPDGFPVCGWRITPFLPAAAALDAHRQNFEPAPAYVFGPPLRFPIARLSETQWSIELATPWDPGGTVFSHDLEVEIEYASFAHLLDTYAELLETGAFTANPGGWATLSRDAERREQERRLPPDRSHGLYGRARRFPAADPALWPEHWRAAAGLDLRDRRPRGATHTVAELVEAARDGHARGRVAATVLGLYGLGSDMLVVVSDGTAAIDVWCPAGVSPWGPRYPGRYEFELELGVAIPAAPAMTLERPTPAVAVAVRPLE
jgi:hypothetical protein